MPALLVPRVKLVMPLAVMMFLTVAGMNGLSSWMVTLPLRPEAVLSASDLP